MGRSPGRLRPRQRRRRGPGEEGLRRLVVRAHLGVPRRGRGRLRQHRPPGHHRAERRPRHRGLQRRRDPGHLRRRRLGLLRLLRGEPVRARHLLARVRRRGHRLHHRELDAAQRGRHLHRRPRRSPLPGRRHPRVRPRPRTRAHPDERGRLLLRAVRRRAGRPAELHLAPLPDRRGPARRRDDVPLHQPVALLRRRPRHGQHPHHRRQGGHLRPLPGPGLAGRHRVHHRQGPRARQAHRAHRRERHRPQPRRSVHRRHLLALRPVDAGAVRARRLLHPERPQAGRPLRGLRRRRRRRRLPDAAHVVPPRLGALLERRGREAGGPHTRSTPAPTR